MTAIRKFLFDIDFTERHAPGAATAAESEAVDDSDEDDAALEMTEEEILPTFSEDEVNAARDAGFKAGREQGIQEAGSAIEQRISETLARMNGNFATLFDAQQTSIEEIRDQAVRLAGALAKKVLPTWSEREGLDEIERLATDLLGRLHSEPRLVFAVNDGLCDPVKARLASIVENRGIESSIEIIGDPAIAMGDCRVEWSDGGAERNTAKLIGEIDDIIARNTGEPADSQSDAHTVATMDERPDPTVGEEAIEASPAGSDVGMPTEPGHGDMEAATETEPPPSETRDEPAAETETEGAETADETEPASEQGGTGAEEHPDGEETPSDEEQN
ncbi:MAG: hypothetical protein MI741_13020 [Rhodospirillales bacterium]|nr:hypothetical protein [Rhodospirillales bacterium]